MDKAIPIWFEYADSDLETARFLFEKQDPPQLEIICYHCQQAGEKAVKALYLAAKFRAAYQESMIFGSCWSR